MKRDLIAVKMPNGGGSWFSRLFGRRPDSGAITYSVAGTAAPSAAAPGGIELRHAARRRTRLRAGKILDRANRFLMDAAIIDRSPGGFRLQLARDGAVPEIFHFFDEECAMIFAARIVWRRQGALGARLRLGGPAPATPRQLMELRGKFYAMKD